MTDRAGLNCNSEKMKKDSEQAREKAETPDLLAVARGIDPGAGHLISIKDLRAAAGMGKTEFDTEIIRLRQDGKIFLHRHVHPGRMNDAEKADCVECDNCDPVELRKFSPEGDKNYYMGLVIRTDNSQNRQDKAVQEEFDGIVKELAEKSQGKFSLQNCIQELHRKRQGTSHNFKALEVELANIKERIRANIDSIDWTTEIVPVLDKARSYGWQLPADLHQIVMNMGEFYRDEQVNQWPGRSPNSH